MQEGLKVKTDLVTIRYFAVDVTTKISRIVLVN